MTTIAALFVAHGGCYYGLPDVEPWGLPERDARDYAGPHPVVAHPPCARWCRLAKLVEAQHGIRVGADGGCFVSALRSVRNWGGVLEHPAWSMAWPAYGLLEPNARGWTLEPMFGSRYRNGMRGWVCEVSQAAYGHRAPKLTWLYYVGIAPPPALDWSRPAYGTTVTTSRRSRRRPGLVEMTSHKERAATPIPFRDVLLSIARSARRTVAA